MNLQSYENNIESLYFFIFLIFFYEKERNIYLGTYWVHFFLKSPLHPYKYFKMFYIFEYFEILSLLSTSFQFWTQQKIRKK